MGKVIPFDWEARLANDRAESARSAIKIRMLTQAIRVEYQKEMQATLAGNGHYTLEELTDFKAQFDQDGIALDGESL